MIRTRASLPAVRGAGVAGVMVLCLLGLSPGDAIARTKPPDAALRAHGHRIEGARRGSYCWTSGNSGQCVSEDYIADWHPPFKRVRRGRAQIRIHYAVKPRRAHLCAERFKGGHEVGPCRHIDVRTERVDSVRGRRWDVLFLLPKPGHYRLDAFFQWNPGDHAQYSLGVKVVPKS